MTATPRRFDEPRIDLNGKTVAFPSPNALGASLLMRADLERLHKIFLAVNSP